MHRKDAIYLDQLCPKINNKSWKQSLNKITKYKCIYCGKPSESLDHLHPKSKGAKAAQAIVYLVVCHVMARSQIRKYLVGIENKIFMIPEDLWQYEHGLMMI